MRRIANRWCKRVHNKQRQIQTSLSNAISLVQVWERRELEEFMSLERRESEAAVALKIRIV